MDVKQCSDEKYLKYAGCSLNDVLEFLKIADKNKVKTWIRTVIIPKINDDEESVKKIYELIKDFNCVYKYELLAFHTLGFSKYEKLKINNPLSGYKGLSEETFKSLNDFLFKLKKGSNIL